jgi:hypothetical protein
VLGRLRKDIRTPKSHRNSIGDSRRCTFDEVWLEYSTASAQSLSKCAGLLDVAAFLDISVQRGLADSCGFCYLGDALLRCRTF